MPLESASYISGLVPTNPAGSDLVSAGDDHLRLIKTVLKNTFPNLSGAVTVTPAELNLLSGALSNIQAQLNLKAPSTHTHAETDIADGGVFPRLSGNETIIGTWNFTVRPKVNSQDILDASSQILESNITDGLLLARLAANENVTGSWNFQISPLAAGLGVFHWATAGLTSARVYLQNTTPPATGTPGDIYFVHE